MKITRNLSSSYQIEVQHMECLLLLHSPMIIDMEELSKFEEDLDLINFLSNVDIVCGCIYMKEEHSISFIHEIVLNEEYNMFGDLMSFLLDCALAQITNKTYHIISFCDLHKKIAKGKEWILLTDVDVNVDFVQYAKVLGWENKEVYKSTWSRSKIVPFAMIAELLNELSFKEKQEFSPNERRTSKYFNDLKKMQNKTFFNKNLFKLEEDESESDEIYYENSLRKMASNVMLKISSLLELVHTNNGGEPSEYIPFSFEAALLSSTRSFLIFMIMTCLSQDFPCIVNVVKQKSTMSPLLYIQ